jgi:tetratricopeptide (TPR) repeat protein
MGRHHPTRETLSRFTEGELPPEEARGIERHLDVCSDCRDRAEEISALERLQLLDSWLNPAYTHAIDEAFDRAVAGAARRLAGMWGEDQSSEELIANLLREPAPTRRWRVRDEERFHTLKLAQLLRTRSRESWFSDPATGLDLAELAVVVTQHLDPRRYGADLVEDALALSWAYLGNSYRIMSDLWRAEKALRQAWSHHVQGGGDPYTEAELFNITASLRKVQGQFDEALRFSDRAIVLFRDLKDRQLEGSTLIQKGLYLGDQGHYEEAIPILWKGLTRIDPERDPRLLLTGKHNLIRLLSPAGAPDKALQLLEECRPLYRELGDRMNLVRMGWAEGNIRKDLGRFAEAEVSLREVREVLLDCQLGVDVFLVSMDLAEVYAQTGRQRQVRAILSEVIPLGEAMGMRRDVMIARLLYEQVSRR